MQWSVEEVELTARPSPITLDAAHDGIGLLARYRGAPVHFSLHDLRPAASLTADEVRELLRRHAAEDLATWQLAQRLRGDTGAVAPPVSLTVAICTHARTPLLEACLRSLGEVLEEDGSVEVLVVDNAPPDGSTRALARATPRLRYVMEPRPGLDFARNRALRECTTTFLAFLDDDVEVDRGWLGGLRGALGDHPDAAALTGLVLPFELETEAQVLFERRGGFRRGFTQLRYQGARLPTNPLYPEAAGIFGAGCNMVFRREALVALGGFDEALDTGAPLPGGGDLDIFHRVVRAGLPLVYEPRMAVFHKHRREHAALRRQYWSWGEGFMAFLAKTWGESPAQRPRIARVVVWWLDEYGRRLVRSLRGRAHLPPDLAAAELAGGLVGLGGSYRRSRRRVARIAAGP